MDRDRASNESSELFRVVAETASDAIISIDRHSIILFANPATERIFGYAISEILGQQVSLLMPECFRHLHEASAASYVNTGQKHIPWTGLKLTGLHKSGAEIPLEISFGKHVRDGRHIFTGILRDVSERSRIEQELRHSQEKYTKMIHSSPDAITLRSLPDRRYIEISDGFTRLTGYTAEEVIGKTPSEIGIWPDDSPHTEILENIQRARARSAKSSSVSEPRPVNSVTPPFLPSGLPLATSLTCFPPAATLPSGAPSNANSCNPRKWTLSAGWPAASRATSTTCLASSSDKLNCFKPNFSIAPRSTAAPKPSSRRDAAPQNSPNNF
jgi:PAS domain S-box-containing protein